MNLAIVKISYLIAAALFIIGLRGMSHPRSAVRGNIIAAIGMGIALLVTFVQVQSVGLVLFGLIVGSVIGGILAYKIAMTDMPQLVALFNGFGGAASIFVAASELMKLGNGTLEVLIATALSGMIGSVTFWGSLVAFGKLQELKIFDTPIPVPEPAFVNVGLACALLVFVTWFCTVGGSGWLYIMIVVVASVLGVLLVNAIGGADMPVVIALLNSYSGLAAAANGFVIDNNVLIIAGSLVGASGIILTQIMCKAMNRSLANVLFGGINSSSSAADADAVYANVRSTSAVDVAMILDGAQRVIFVPGYGMAVAQAQHAVRDLSNLLEKNGVEVEYAIHPVAGRMPGHMNVLLAEADVPYDKLKEMDEINATMETADVAIVIGANDVVNPVAKTDPQSPIAGMPIIDVDKARTVIVIKRSLSPGFAKIPNPLFAADNTLMFFSDGKQAILDTITAMKEM